MKSKKADITNQMNSIVDIDVISTEAIYDCDFLEQSEATLRSKRLYDVATSIFPQSKRKIYVIDKHSRLLKGHNRISLMSANPNEFKNARMWFHPFKKLRDDSDYRLTGNPNVDNVFEVTSIINPQTYFEQCEDWRDKLDTLFYQGFMKDPRIVNAFKCCMPPLPFNPRKWQRFNNHVFLFTQTKTGKTAFSEEVLGQYVVTEPSGPGLAGGILGKSVTTGILQGKGFCMLDEINATETEVFDLILNLMENGVGNRGKVGQPSCATTKTIMFCGNPEDDVPELLAMDFRNILTTLTQDGSNVERLSGRLGLFLYGIDFQQVKQIHMVEPEELDLIRGLIYDTFAVYQEKYEECLMRMTKDWLFQDDDAWGETVKKLAPLARDGKVHQFIIGWKHSVDNMRMAALRWTLLENLDKFVLKPLDELLDKEFMKELGEKYEYVKNEINLSSLKNLTKIDFKTTYEIFREMVTSHTVLKTKSERELQRLFGLGSSHTIAEWLRRVDNDELIDFNEEKPVEINEINLDLYTILDIIRRLQDKKEFATEQEVVSEALDYSDASEERIQKLIVELKKNGDINEFKPKQYTIVRK